MPTYHPAQPHDIISISALTKQGISQKTAKLYGQGLSLRAISTELRISKTAARSHLMGVGVPLRTHSNNQLKDRDYPRKPSIKTAPYGFCLVDGKLHPDPKEQGTLHLILKWWQQGISHCAIAKTIHSKKIKPRKASKWSQPTIGFIIKRNQSLYP